VEDRRERVAGTAEGTDLASGSSFTKA